MADPQKLKLMLDSLPTSTRVRAAVWDAFNEPDDARVKARLDALPLDQATKAQLWDAAAAPADPVPTPPAPAPEPEDPYQPFVPPWFNPDLYAGLAKSLGRSAVGAGQLVAQVPGVAPAINAGYDALGFSGVDTKQALADALLQPELAYQGGTQEAGGLLGDVAQFALPGPSGKMALPARLGREAVTGGLITALQGGSPGEVGVSAGIGAGSQVVSPFIAKLPRMLRRQAIERAQKFLGGTKERYKEMGARIAPSVLRRDLGWPLGASREGMLATASSRVTQLGAAVRDMISASGGTTVKGKPIYDRLEHLKDAYRTPRVVTAAELAASEKLQREAFQLPTGEFAVYTIFDKRPIQQLTKLQRVIAELGDDIPLEKLIPLRRAWDDVVDQAGGYAQRAKGGIGVKLKESSEAWAKREGSEAIRKVLAQDAPDLTKLNKEFSFWKKLEDVLTQTQKRTAPQQGGLGKTIFGAAGMGAGLMAGGDVADKAEKAIFYGTIGGGLQAALTSPRYRLVSAHLRVRLADAIASGDAQRVATALGRVINAMGVPLRQGEGVRR